ncbi:hypothetical protein JCM10450v2_007372 [Rhodotorula kratochvilovae]
MLAKLLIALSSAALLHAAYAAWQARTAAKLAGVHLQPVLGAAVPLEITAEALSAFFVLVLGVLWTAPAPKGVSFASEMATRSIDTTDSGAAFANLRTRGRVLFGPEAGGPAAAEGKR